MATQVVAKVDNLRMRRARERIFFCGIALLMIAAILLGFRQTYFPLSERPAALSSWAIQLHGAVFSLFLLLLLVQTSLIAARRVRWHMALGLWVYGLAALMIPIGIVSAADELRRDLNAGPPYGFGIDPRTFSLVSVMGMAIFGTLMAWSFAARRTPDVHKRLALYATLSMMDAGIDRWPWAAWHVQQTFNRGWPMWVFTAYLLAPAIYDLISLRRVHWVTMSAAPFVWILEMLEIPLGQTRAWHAIADFMLRYLAFHHS